MPMPKTIVLAITATVAIMAQSADVEADSRGGHRHFFNPDRGGGHYDTVMANYTRRCTDLSGQFARSRAGIPDSPRVAEASALHDQGVSHCNGGARLQGIDELTAAIRQIGAIPRVTL